MLRHVEALRLYADANNGKLPARLTDIPVPLPVDPFTGKPFEYRCTGDRAALHAAAMARPVPKATPIPQDALYYEIVTKK